MQSIGITARHTKKAAVSERRSGLGEHPVIVTPGPMVPAMGLEYMVRALPRILDRYPDAFYVCVGAAADGSFDGSDVYLSCVERLAHLTGVEDSLGLVVDDDTGRQEEEWLMAADICVFPCAETPVPRTDLLGTALGSGKPIVVTSLVELPCGPGVIVPAAYHLALEQAVLRLLHDPQPRQTVKKHESEAYAGLEVSER
ncbi:MAG: glycosyltransferase [Armatimonadetes bacterium]|nr:glycosyltransferase [Armatimonadota bacterium]